MKRASVAQASASVAGRDRGHRGAVLKRLARVHERSWACRDRGHRGAVLKHRRTDAAVSARKCRDRGHRGAVLKLGVANLLGGNEGSRPRSPRSGLETRRDFAMALSQTSRPRSPRSGLETSPNRCCLFHYQSRPRSPRSGLETSRASRRSRRRKCRDRGHRGAVLKQPRPQVDGGRLLGRDRGHRGAVLKRQNALASWFTAGRDRGHRGAVLKPQPIPYGRSIIQSRD